MASLARLTHLSTQTLTLLVERQRLETLGQAPPATNTSQVVRNLEAMRNGIMQLEQNGMREDSTCLGLAHSICQELRPAMLPGYCETSLSECVLCWAAPLLQSTREPSV